MALSISRIPKTRAGRSQLTQILAIGLLLFVWIARWLVVDISNDHSWLKGKADGTVSSSAHASSSPSTVDRTPQSQPLPESIDLSDPDAPFVSWPLKRTCGEVEQWLPGVVFMCDNNFGGVGNMRNFILTCIRYAIEAGATGLVVPRIRKRKDDDIKVIVSEHDQFMPFDYLFDEEHFRAAMAESCPQITLYDEWTSVPNVQYVDNTSIVPYIQKFEPRILETDDTEGCVLSELDKQTDRFGYRFRQLVSNPEFGMAPSANYTRLFRGNDSPGLLWVWPVWRDGPELATTFAGLCKFNKTIMQLGKKALASMHEFARERHMEVAAQASQHSIDEGRKGRLAIPASDEKGPAAAAASSSSRFFGMHLRTEADALPFWPTYEEQEEAYLRKAAGSGLKVGYVASGNLSEARKLQSAASAEVGMALVTKDDLLRGEDLGRLHAMSWDQQGLVDYVVLAGAEYFAGNGRSSFSISVSQKRHLKGEGLYARPYKVRPDGYGTSFIVGPMTRYYEHWLFIWDAMWP